MIKESEASASDSAIEGGNMEFCKINQRGEIPIETVPDEHDESRDFEPSFWWDNRRHFLSSFIRVHGNPWITDCFPDYIHGMQSDGTAQAYENPLFVELLGDAAVNVYEERSVV